MVVKPLPFIARGQKGYVQPAVKCRGVDSPDKNATDYSLQLSSGINFFNMSQPPGFHPQQ